MTEPKDDANPPTSAVLTPPTFGATPTTIPETPSAGAPVEQAASPLPAPENAPPAPAADPVPGLAPFPGLQPANPVGLADEWPPGTAGTPAGQPGAPPPNPPVDVSHPQAERHPAMTSTQGMPQHEPPPEIQHQGPAAPEVHIPPPPNPPVREGARYRDTNYYQERARAMEKHAKALFEEIDNMIDGALHHRQPDSQ